MQKLSFLSFFIFYVLFTLQVQGQTKHKIQIDSLLEVCYQRGIFNGNALILNQGQVIYSGSKGFTDGSKTHELNKKSVFDIGSISKEFNAVAIMMLKEKGLLTLDDKISKYELGFPDWSNNVTIKNLLQYTSGLPLIDWENTHGDNDIYQNLKYLKVLEFEPGKGYLYSNNNILVQRLIIEKVVGKSFNEYLLEDILKPLNMNNSVIDHQYANSNFVRGFNSNGVNDHELELKMSGWVCPSIGDLEIWTTKLMSNKIISKESLYSLFEAYSDESQSALGNGKFKESVNALGLNDSGRTWSCQPLDVNRDGWMDLYVINDFGLSNFYISEKGVSFIDATEEYNLKNTGDGMGSSIGDFNNDGFFDIYVTNISEIQSNPLFAGSSEGPFKNVGQTQGVGNAHFGWGNRFFDADNDGDQDLYAVNGMADLKYDNKFFKNLKANGTDKFTDWSSPSATDGHGNGMAVEVFDFDNNGFLDILVSNVDDAPYLYQNNTANPNKWLQVELEGTISNRDALGATAIAYTQNNAIHRLKFAVGVMGQSIKPLHFGLGETQKIDSLEVLWPSGNKETIHNISTNQKIKVLEENGMVKGNIFNEEDIQPVAIKDALPEIKKSMDMKAYYNIQNRAITFEIKKPIEGVLSLNIYSLLGKSIYSLKAKTVTDQDYILEWTGHSQQGQKLPSGVYIYSIDLEKSSWHGKMLIDQ